MPPRPPLIVLCGPTASGKTALAVALARRWPLEVVSADSRQVYREMDIGTAKPTPQEQAQVRHHLLDVVNPDEPFSAADFERLGRDAVADIRSRGRLPLVVGGTGLYIRALTEGLVEAPGADHALRARLAERERREGPGCLHRLLAACDPEAAERLPPTDTVRIIRALEVFEQCGRPLSVLQRDHAFGDRPYRTLVLGLSPPRDDLYRRIEQRVDAMFAAGLLTETRGLLARYDPGLKAMQTLGYRESIRCLQGEITADEAREEVKKQTRRYAKRQLTWFRHQKGVHWIESSEEFDTIVALIDEFCMQ